MVSETKSTKNKNITLLMTIFLGYFGGHYFYVGRFGMGLIYLCTNGLFIIGWVYDIYRVLAGQFKDHNGQKIEGFTGPPPKQQARKQKKYKADGTPEDIYVDATVVEPNGAASYQAGRYVQPEAQAQKKTSFSENVKEKARNTAEQIRERAARLAGRIFNRRVAAVFGVVLVATALVTGLAYSIYYSVQDQKKQETYQEAVADIQDLNFGDAKRELSGLDIEDSQALEAYCDLQMNLTSYRGKPRDLSEDLKNIGELKDHGVQAQYQNALAQVDKAIALQDEINQSSSDQTVNFNQDPEARAEEIDKKLSDIDVRYRVLVEE